MDLFTVGKIPMYCEGITHRIEQRPSGAVKVVDLTLKIEPCTAQIAAALNQDEYGIVKRTLYKLSDGEPVADLRAVEFKAASARQNMRCYIAPDVEEASICLTQVKVAKIRARVKKAATGWALYVYVSFGPLDRVELEYVNAFYCAQRFVSWEAAEASLDFGDQAPAAEAASQGAPMFEGAVAPERARHPRRHGARSTH